MTVDATTAEGGTSGPLAFEVRRDDLRRTRVVVGRPGAVRVDRIALTANTVTYGVMGDALGYWSIFPASEPGWGVVPAWGLGTVLATGQQLYGLFPMASHVDLDLDDELVDRSAHRQALSPLYNRYLPMAPDTPHLDEQLVLRPLLGTSFLLADALADERATVVVASASSKTALGLALLLEQPVVGLTSPRHRAFVASLGAYDRVLAYDEVGELAGVEGPLAYVDPSGNAAVRAAVRDAVGPRLRRDVVVGATHWREMGEPPGDAEVFFAPSHLEAMTARLGAGELRRRMGAALVDLMRQAGARLTIERSSGTEALDRVWGALLDGAVDPDRAHVVSVR
jgi:hypothetical protein